MKRRIILAMALLTVCALSLGGRPAGFRRGADTWYITATPTHILVHFNVYDPTVIECRAILVNAEGGGGITSSVYNYETGNDVTVVAIPWDSTQGLPKQIVVEEVRAVGTNGSTPLLENHTYSVSESAWNAPEY